MRPQSECLAMFFNVKAAVSRMCLVTGPSFSSYRKHNKTQPSLDSAAHLSDELTSIMLTVIMSPHIEIMLMSGFCRLSAQD